MSVQRPLSPHLQVYQPQLTSTLSILHRLTGLFLCLGAMTVIGWVWMLAAGPDTYGAYAVFAASPFAKGLLAVSVFALTFHLGNGIRHLFWDVGAGFELGTVYRSGWTVVAFACIATVALLASLRGAL
jgi:succinate dehydrogenase / fumarate reductase, cytochrome b subunit